MSLSAFPPSARLYLSVHLFLCSFVGVHVSGEVQIPAPPYTHTPGCPASNTGWIVAVAIVGAILLLGLLALIIIKLILLILVSETPSPTISFHHM